MIRFNPFFGVRCLVPNVVATGGTVTEQDVNGVNYKVHRFNTNGTFTVLKDGENLEYFVVGGGGGGSGTDSAFNGGGGGAGGAITNNFGNGITISADTYTITVGDGGTGGALGGSGSAGAASLFDSIATAAGGPGGFRLSGNTGLGGAAGEVNGATPGAGESGAGSVGGGGGGSVTAAGGDASSGNGGNGANGFDASLILGTTFGETGFFAGGGGGGAANTSFTAGTGGLGGGGDGGNGSFNFGQATRTTNTGGGGGGNGFTLRRTGAGGDRGIVVIRYPKYIDTCLPPPPPPEFIMEVNTTIAGETGSNTFRLPTSGSGYNFSVDWGDGVTESYTGSPGNIDHVYSAGGVYDISITGEFPRIRFVQTNDRSKLLKVKQWGTIQWANWESAFSFCNNLQITATDVPNVSNVLDMQRAFQSCSNPNFGTAHNFDVWDVSNVTNMLFMFTGTNFNRPIGNWDVGNVQTFQGMFESVSAFNQYIGDWNTSSGGNYRTMFLGCGAFNQDISGWNTTNASNMDFMFASAATFNQDLSPWCVSQFPSEPTGFSSGTTAWVLPKPNWGAPC
jgi:surface protein